MASRLLSLSGFLTGCELLVVSGVLFHGGILALEPTSFFATVL
jgi:hypothetical protein